MTILFIVFVFVALVRLCFDVCCIVMPFGNGERRQDKTRQTNTRGVSVIICAKNEAKQLETYLPALLNQSYSKYEVVVVNDNSTDGSAALLKGFAEKYPRLQVVNTNSTLPYKGKKQALLTGASAAQYDWLVCTDADCFVQAHWIESFMQQMDHKDQFVIGFGPYYVKQGWLNSWARYEMLVTAANYSVFTQLGMPYMCVGRNMAVHKSVFNKKHPFGPQLDCLSGSDDLLVQQAAKEMKFSLNFDDENLVFSQAKQSWKSYFMQKRRHLSTGRHYNLKLSVLLTLLNCSHLLYYGLGIAFLMTNFWWFTLIIMLIRMLVSGVSQFRMAKHFKYYDLKYTVVLFDIIFPLYFLIFAPVMLLNKPSAWQGNEN